MSIEHFSVDFQFAHTPNTFALTCDLTDAPVIDVVEFILIPTIVICLLHTFYRNYISVFRVLLPFCSFSVATRRSFPHSRHFSFVSFVFFICLKCIFILILFMLLLFSYCTIFAFALFSVLGFFCASSYVQVFYFQHSLVATITHSHQTPIYAYV